MSRRKKMGCVVALVALVALMCGASYLLLASWLSEQRPAPRPQMVWPQQNQARHLPWPKRPAARGDRDSASIKPQAQQQESATADRANVDSEQEDVPALPRSVEIAPAAVPKTSPGSAEERTIEIVGINDEMSGEPQISGGWRDVTIYWAPYCRACTHAMKRMDALEVRYRKRNIESDLDARRDLYALAQERGIDSVGIPTITVAGQRDVLVGWDERRFLAVARRP